MRGGMAQETSKTVVDGVRMRHNVLSVRLTRPWSPGRYSQVLSNQAVHVLVRIANSGAEGIAAMDIQARPLVDCWLGAIQIADHGRPLVEGVSDGCPKCRLRKNLVPVLLKPFLDSEHDRPTVPGPKRKEFIVFATLDIAFDPVELTDRVDDLGRHGCIPHVGWYRLQRLEKLAPDVRHARYPDNLSQHVVSSIAEQAAVNVRRLV